MIRFLQLFLLLNFSLILEAQVQQGGYNVYNPVLNPTITGPDSVCAGSGGYIYTTEAGMTGYSWTISPGGNITAGSGTDSVTVLWIIPGQQTISVTYDSVPSPTIKNVTVKPTISPGISISASANPFCDTPVTFTATTINGGISPAYQWKVNCVNVGTNSPAFTYMPVNGDFVNCVMTTSLSCVSANPVYSNIIEMQLASLTPAVSIAVSANPICAGTSVIFTATPVNGGPSPYYAWRLNGLPVGASGPTFTYTPSNYDSVTCQMTSNSACVNIGNPATSNKITMNVYPLLAAGITISASTNPFCPGSSVTYMASAVNPGPTPIYQWKVNSINAGTNSPIYTYSPSSGDSVRCILTSSAMCIAGPSTVSSNTIAMTTTTAGTVGVSIVASANPVCQGNPVTFTATPLNAGSSPVYQWKKNGMSIGSGSIYTGIPSNGDIINCIINSSGPCYIGSPAVSNSITMTVLPIQPVSISIVASANPVNTGSVVTFTATPVNGGLTPVFQWKVNGNNVGTNSSVFIFIPVNGDVVTCQITSSLPCTAGNPATSNAIAMALIPYLPVSVSICASSNPVCSGTSVTFTAISVNGGTAPTYQWRLNNCVIVGNNSPIFTYTPSQGDIVICRLTSNACCANPATAWSNTIIMQVATSFTIGVGIMSVPYPCPPGIPVTFTAIPVNPGFAPVYQWMVNGVNAPTNNPTFNYIPSCGDTVRCRLTSSISCTANNPVLSPPFILTTGTSVGGTVSGGYTIAFGQNTGPLTLSGQAGGVLKWQRQFNGTGYSDILSTTGLTVYSEVPSSMGTWDYRASVMNGICSAVAYSTPATVNVISGPFTRVWYGSQGDDWKMPLNWSPDGVPCSVDNVMVPESPVVFPTVKDPGLTCNNLFLFDGASLSVLQNKSLSIMGDLLMTELFSVPFSTACPVIDGQIGALEWVNANTYPVKFFRNDGDSSHEGTLYLQHDDHWLYLGIESNWISGNNVYMQLRFDGDHNHSLQGNPVQPHTDIQVECPSPGCYSGYKDFAYLVGTNAIPVPEPLGTEKASSGSSDVTYEFKINLDDLKALAGSLIGLYLKHGNDGNPDHDYEYLINKSSTIPIEYRHIKL